jgi:hypothetical protein
VGYLTTLSEYIISDEFEKNWRKRLWPNQGTVPEWLRKTMKIIIQDSRCISAEIRSEHLQNTSLGQLVQRKWMKLRQNKIVLTYFRALFLYWSGEKEGTIELSVTTAGNSAQEIRARHLNNTSLYSYHYWYLLGNCWCHDIICLG